MTTCCTTGLIYFGIIVVIGALGGYLLAKQALRPIAKLTQTAQQLSTETLDQRINLGGPDDELRELADTFDEMLGPPRRRVRQPATVRRQRQPRAAHPAVGDPHRARGDAVRPGRRRRRAAPDGRGRRQATERAQRLVGSLLTLARLQAGVRGELEVREPVDLADAGAAASRGGAAARPRSARHHDRDTRSSRRATVGDPRLLERLIGNLVENAIRHNVPGGWLRITLRRDGRAGLAARGQRRRA